MFWQVLIATLVGIWLGTRLQQNKETEIQAGSNSSGGISMGSPLFEALVGKVPSQRGETVITEGTAGVTTAVNTLNVLSTILSYPVQRGQVLHLRPSDFIYLDAQSGVPADLPANSYWELQAADPSQRSVKVITAGVLGQVQNNQDSTLKKYLGVAYSLGPDYILRVQLNSSVALVVANSDYIISGELEFASL